MKQTKEILKALESRYTNIDYYQTIIQKIEENVESHPDISIESCKALLEVYQSSFGNKLTFRMMHWLPTKWIFTR
jgi:hypothetical protein